MQGEISAGGLIIGGIIGQRGAPGNGIVSITLTGTSGLEDTYTILYTNGDTDTFVVTNGATGNGIVSITKTSSVGLVDTYTILYTNGSSDTIEVHNGEKGDKGDKGDTGLTPNLTIGSVTKGADASATITGTTDNPVLNLVLPKGDKGDKGDTGNTGATGVGIYSITKTGTADLVDTYTILYTNGDTQTYTITNGAKGDTGATGNGISTITKTGTAGLVDTYTITFTDGNTTTFDVTNGADGNVTDVQVEGVSVVDNGVANITGLATQAELDYYKTIYNVLPKVSGNGESITLDNTGESILKLDLKGNTSQNTTTGKNLLETKIVTETKDGVTITYNEDGTYTLNGTATAGTFFQSSQYSKTLASGTYTFSSSVTMPNGLFYSLIQGNGTYVFFTRNGTDTATITLTEETTYSALKEYIWIANGTTFNNLTLKPQLETGSTATSFEEYTGGIASPNPDYPQVIHTITGDNEVVVCGKNLLPFTNQDFTLNSVRYYSQNGKLYLNGTSSSETSANNSNFKNNFAFTLEAGTYTFKKNIVGSRNQSYFFISINKYDDDERLTRVNDTTSEATFTLTQTTKVYLGFYVYQQVFNAETFGLQLEKSATPTTYEPHKSNSVLLTLGDKEICKIGNYEDKIFKAIKGNEIYDSLASEEKATLDYGKWYLRKAIGKVVLDGTNKPFSAQMTTSGTGEYRYRIDNTGCINSASGSTLVQSYCNRLIAKTANMTYSKQQGIAYNDNNNQLIAFIDDIKTSTLSQANTWLETNNLEVYYILATPYLSPVEDTTLISQLDNIQNAMSYEGQTNVSQVNNDKPFIIDATALRSLLDYGSGE